MLTTHSTTVLYLQTHKEVMAAFICVNCNGDAGTLGVTVQEVKQDQCLSSDSSISLASLPVWEDPNWPMTIWYLLNQPQFEKVEVHGCLLLFNIPHYQDNPINCLFLSCLFPPLTVAFDIRSHGMLLLQSPLYISFPLLSRPPSVHILFTFKTQLSYELHAVSSKRPCSVIPVSSELLHFISVPLHILHYFRVCVLVMSPTDMCLPHTKQILNKYLQTGPRGSPYQGLHPIL